MLPTISGEFRLVDDPELRFTPSGKAVVEVRLVASKRKKDGDDWVDDKTCWINAVAWQEVAENIAESLSKGDLVEVRGALYTESWEDKDGNKRSTMKIQLYGIGPALARATAKVSKTERSTGGGGDDPWSGGSSPTNQGPRQSNQEDPWAPGPPPSDEPPF